MVRDEEVDSDTQIAKKQKIDENSSTGNEEGNGTSNVNLESEDSDAVVENKDPPKPKIILDPYQANLKQEESEVQRRSETEDKQLFVEICQCIQNLMKEICTLKNDKDDDWQENVEEKKVQILMLVLSLRRLSRVQKIRVRDSRDQTGDARQGVDSVTLQLQNLLYEVAHLKKEIKRCLDFNSADQNISLIDLNDFYNEAPESICQPALTLEDPHQQHLARLNWELEQRRGQTSLFKKLSEQKQSLADVITEQESKLSSLLPSINAVLDATAPLQETLGLTLDSQRELNKTAELLPIPLYTLWVQVTGYAEACDSTIKSEIKGDHEAAKAVAVFEARTRDTSEGKSTRTSRGKGNTVETVKKPSALHPLSICITVPDENGNKIVVTFNYASTLRVVTVTCQVELVEKLKLHIEGVLNKESILECLLSDDYGFTSPNPASLYHLQKEDLKDLLPVIGRPFRWAQSLCGLSFLKDDPLVAQGSNMDTDSKDNSSDESVTQPPKIIENVSSELSAEHMDTIINGIRNRLSGRMVLHAQFANLLSCTTTSFTGINLRADLLKANFPAKINSNLNSWRPMTWSDYGNRSTTELLREHGSVTNHFMFYKAILERNTANLEALVAISPNYPEVSPVFSLSLTCQGQHNATSNPHIRQMECEVNVHWKELIQKEDDQIYILPLLLYRLLLCLDIYTEAHCSNIDSSEQFTKEKDFFRDSRGPDRALPYKYDNKSGKFSQR